MTAADLTCQELVELVTDYLEGALSTSERVRFEEHLATCPGCPEYLEQMRQTIRTLGSLREDSIDLEVRHELLQLLRAWKRG